MIETERLHLRNWRDQDIAPFIRHTNTPAVMRWLGGVKPEHEMKAIVEDRLMRWQDERGFTFWVVERKADRALLGFCGLKIADAGPIEGEYEVGWRLREDAWGRVMRRRRRRPRSIMPSRRSAPNRWWRSPSRRTWRVGA